MKINLKQNVCAFIAVCTLVTSGSVFAKDKTVGEKVDQAIDKTEETAESTKNKAKDKSKETADKAKEKAHDAKEKAKEKAHEGVDKL